MRRPAFTLVELMVVITIVALLAAMLLPSVTSAFALARSTVCQANLHRLSDGFASAKSQNALAGGGASPSGVLGTYPQAMQWPYALNSVLPDPLVYYCPDDTAGKGVGALQNSLKRLEYKCPYRMFPLDTMSGLASFYLSRRGVDAAKGPYTEYMLEDDEGNGQLQMLDWMNWWDSDGYIIIYDTGDLLVPNRVPLGPSYPAPNSGDHGPGCNSSRVGVNTCGNMNNIYLDGRPLWPPDGELQPHAGGPSTHLPNWSVGNTNYGISSYACQYPYGSKCILLADYKDQIINLDTPVETEDLLIQSGRHPMGKLNLLRGDGSVKSAMPMAITPRDPQYLPLWRPEEGALTTVRVTD